MKTSKLDLQNKIEAYEKVVNNLSKLAVNASNDYAAELYDNCLIDCEKRLRKLKQLETPLNT